PAGSRCARRARARDQRLEGPAGAGGPEPARDAPPVRRSPGRHGRRTGRAQPPAPDGGNRYAHRISADRGNLRAQGAQHDLRLDRRAHAALIVPAAPFSPEKECQMNLHTKLATLGLSLAIAGAAHAQTVQGMDGRWEGALDVGGAALTLVFRIETADGATKLLLDSPDQGANGIETADLKRDGQKVSFIVPSIGGAYAGDLSVDGNTLTGAWSQLDQSLPLVMTRK